MQWWEGLEDEALAGRYRIERKVGEGGMAEVFLARQEPLGRKVAIKVPKLSLDDSPHLLRRFRREVERQNHERIVGVIGLLDAGECTGSDGRKRPYLVMEYVSGGSLADMLGGRFGARLHRQNLEDVLIWLVPIAATLDRLHGRGLLHRDVKPDNILFNADGDPQLSDFGIATSLDEAQGGADGGSTSMWIVGSPGYMSPEIVASEKAAASDQFSLGITVYEALSGRLPMVPQNLGVWMQALANWHPEHLSGLCPELPAAAADAVMRAIASRGGDRFPSCSAFAARVRDALGARAEPEDPAKTAAIEATSLPQASPTDPAGAARAAIPDPPAAQDPRAALPSADDELQRARTIAEGWRYVGPDGRQQGPLSQDSLRKLYANGRLAAASLIWVAGMSQWREYAQVFNQDIPPPVPSASGEFAMPPPVPALRSRPDASRAARFVARFLDGMALFVVLIPFGALSNARNQGDDNPQAAGLLVMIGMAGMVLLLLLQGFFISRDGQSIGKKALGLRIVRTLDGSNPGFVRAFVLREGAYALLSTLSGVTVGIPLLIDILPVFGAERRCLHDHIAGTRVIGRANADTVRQESSSR